MLSSNPKISIVTVNYNMGAFLEKAIQSVIGQNYPNLEYIVIDGGSADNSVEIIKKYEKHIHYWVSEKDKGQSDALNKGLRLCTGDIVAWLNADDFYEPGVFHKIVDTFNRSGPDVGVVAGSSNLITIDNKGYVIDELFFSSPKLDSTSMTTYWKSGHSPAQPSIFWLKEVMDKTNLLDTKLNYAMDLHLWLAFSRHTKFVCIPDLLSNYIIHQDSKSGSAGGFQKFEDELRMVAKEHVKNSNLGFRIIHHIRYILFLTRKKIQQFLRAIKYFIFKILGFIAGVIKKITGIKRFGIFAPRND